MTDDERRAERRGAEKFKEKLDRAGFTGKEYRAIEDAFNELYPPPEPERVWVKLSYGTEHTRDPDGKWWYRFGNGRQVYEYAVTDADIRALASLVPGLVATRAATTEQGLDATKAQVVPDAGMDATAETSSVAHNDAVSSPAPDSPPADATAALLKDDLNELGSFLEAMQKVTYTQRAFEAFKRLAAALRAEHEKGNRRSADSENAFQEQEQRVLARDLGIRRLRERLATFEALATRAKEYAETLGSDHVMVQNLPAFARQLAALASDDAKVPR